MPRLPVLRLPASKRARRRRLRTLLFFTGLVIFTILTLGYIVYKPPEWLIRVFQHEWPDVLWRVDTDAKVVALTIDDAPSDYTAEILDVLRDNSATATFFVIGAQVPGHEEVLADIVSRGHELGNHAMRDEPSRALSDATLAEQIHLVEERIDRAYVAAKSSREPPKFFRPGSGFFSDNMRAILRRLGYRLVLGSIYPHDPQIKYPELNAKHILSMLEPGGIIICHDRRSWTVPMLEIVLPEMRQRGYRVVTVTQLLSELDKVVD